MPNNPKDRILIIDDDAGVSDLIGRQALKSAGYQVEIVNDAAVAISKVAQLAPDVVIVSLSLVGLSGKDLMVALSSQGINAPVIVRARKGAESDIIQAFRLGAMDYIPWPVREAEVIAVVERALRTVHERKERDQLSQKLQLANRELEQRVQELTTLFSIGKAVTSITDQSLLFERILGAAAKVTQASAGWFLLSSDSGKAFILAAHLNLPASIAENINQPWDDGISSLVAVSGETLSIHGEALKRFKIANLGQAALIVPVKVQKQVVGLLVLMRKALQPFTAREYSIMEALADFAAISLANSRLFRTIQDRARMSQSLAEVAQLGEKVNYEILTRVRRDLNGQLGPARTGLDKLVKDPSVRLSQEQRQTMTNLNEQMQILGRIAESINPHQPDRTKTVRLVNLNDMLRLTVNRFQPIAKPNRLVIIADLPEEVLTAQVDASLLAHVVDGLLSNAIKYSTPGGQVTVRLEKTPNSSAHIVITDAGVGMEPGLIERVYETDYQPPAGQVALYGGAGISISLAKQILTSQRGKVWVESQPKKGNKFHIELLLTK